MRIKFTKVVTHDGNLTNVGYVTTVNDERGKRIIAKNQAVEYVDDTGDNGVELRTGRRKARAGETPPVEIPFADDDDGYGGLLNA